MSTSSQSPDTDWVCLRINTETSVSIFTLLLSFFLFSFCFCTDAYVHIPVCQCVFPCLPLHASECCCAYWQCDSDVDKWACDHIRDHYECCDSSRIQMWKVVTHRAWFSKQDTLTHRTCDADTQSTWIPFASGDVGQIHSQCRRNTPEANLHALQKVAHRESQQLVHGK